VGQLLAVAGDQVEAPFEVLEELEVGRRLALEQHDGGDVHVRGVVLQVEEGGVEPTEAFSHGS
jgi:hypothetical protein